MLAMLRDKDQVELVVAHSSAMRAEEVDRFQALVGKPSAPTKTAHDDAETSDSEHDDNGDADADAGTSDNATAADAAVASQATPVFHINGTTTSSSTDAHDDNVDSGAQQDEQQQVYSSHGAVRSHADGNGGVEADGLLRTGTLLELSQRWIDTQPIVAAHWAAGAAALAVEVEASAVERAASLLRPRLSVPKKMPTVIPSTTRFPQSAPWQPANRSGSVSARPVSTLFMLRFMVATSGSARAAKRRPGAEGASRGGESTGKSVDEGPSRTSTYV